MSSAGDRWYHVGPVSSFVDIRPSQITSEEGLQLDSGDSHQEGAGHCKVMQISTSDATKDALLKVAPGESSAESLEHQVLVFRYRGRFHAMDNQCPHQSYPLCMGALHDIEDFGMILSAAITCPKHGWSFDLTTGESSRGRYKLPVWDVEVRPCDAESPHDDDQTDANGQDHGDHIWIRRRKVIKARRFG